jgi:hypothetical protein
MPNLEKRGHPPVFLPLSAGQNILASGDLRRSPAREIRQGQEQNVADVRLRVARKRWRAMEAEDGARLFWEQRFLEAQERGFVPPAASTPPRAPIWPPR